MVQQGYFQENNWKGEFFNKTNSIKDITKLKKNYEWLKEVDSIALQASVENLANGYDKYYKKTGGKPKFKSKKNEIQSSLDGTDYNIAEMINNATKYIESLDNKIKVAYKIRKSQKEKLDKFVETLQ